MLDNKDFLLQRILEHFLILEIHQFVVKITDEQGAMRFLFKKVCSNRGRKQLRVNVGIPMKFKIKHIQDYVQIFRKMKHKSKDGFEIKGIDIRFKT